MAFVAAAYNRRFIVNANFTVIALGFLLLVLHAWNRTVCAAPIDDETDYFGDRSKRLQRSKSGDDADNHRRYVASVGINGKLLQERRKDGSVVLSNRLHCKACVLYIRPYCATRPVTDVTCRPRFGKAISWTSSVVSLQFVESGRFICMSPNGTVRAKQIEDTNMEGCYFYANRDDHVTYYNVDYPSQNNNIECRRAEIETNKSNANCTTFYLRAKRKSGAKRKFATLQHAIRQTRQTYFEEFSENVIETYIGAKTPRRKKTKSVDVEKGKTRAEDTIAQPKRVSAGPTTSKTVSAGPTKSTSKSVVDIKISSTGVITSADEKNVVDQAVASHVRRRSQHAQGRVRTKKKKVPTATLR